MKIPSALLAIDPGLATGIAVVRVNKSDLVLSYSNEFDVLGTGSEVRRLIHDCNHSTQGNFGIVVERFTITSATAKNSQAPWSLKVIGMVEWLVHDELGMDPSRAIITQGPSEAKRLVTNDMLKLHGLWHRGGAGHANDAIRHAVYRYAVLGWRKPWEKRA